MSREIVNAICRAFPGAEVSDPWGGGHDAWKVGGKMFACRRLGQARQHRDSGNADRGRSWREGALSPSLMGEPALGHIGRRASAQAHSILRAGPFQSHEEVASPAPSVRLKGRGAPPRKAESWQLDRRNARVGRRPALRPHAFFPGLAALPEAAGSNGPASDHVAQGGIVCRPHPRKASDLASFRCHVTNHDARCQCTFSIR